MIIIIILLSCLQLTVEGCRVPCSDVVFALDISLSIDSEANFQLMKNFVAGTFSFVNISADCSRAALILFASDAFISFDLNEYTTEGGLRNALDQIQLSDFNRRRVRRGTNTPAVLDLLRVASQDGRLGLSNDNVHIALVMTDGRPNLRHIDRNIDQIEADRRTERAGNRLHQAGVFDLIFAYGIEGQHPIRDTLGFIAEPPSLTFTIAGFNQSFFTEAGVAVAREFCNPCILTSCPTGSTCRICNETGLPYCVYSCGVDNGGCDEGSQCIESVVPTCNPGQCCSPVSVTCQTCDVGKIDCVFVLDVSLSINNDSNFGLVRDLVIQSARQFAIGTNDALFSVILFARHAKINFTIPQYTDRASLINAVNEISYFDTSEFNRTGTNIPEALDLLREGGQDGRIGLRSNTNFTHAIFITDGRPNTRDLVEEQLGERLNRSARQNLRILDEQNSIRAARRLHAAGVYDDVFAIGIRGDHDINFEELDHIASRSELRFEIQDFTQDAFQTVIQQLSEQLCTPCTGFKCPNGSICRECNKTGMPYCEFSCDINNGGCPEGSTCRETPITCPPGQCCSSVNVTCEVCEVNADFVYLLDVSISIGDDANFQEVTNFVSALGQALEIGLNDNLAGVILFARHADIEFDVQEHTNAADFSTAVTSIIYSNIPRLNRTGTNIPEALDLLRTAGQTGGALRFRDDPNIPKIAVFMTDGRPNTRDLTGNSRQQDAINTQNAAARLHESGIYDQIYGIGIQGTREIDFVELRFIASDPGLVFEIADFEGELFEELRRNLTVSICRRQQCTVEGQVYLELAPPPECQPTCSNPMPSCPRLPFAPGCVCPEGTVIDQIKNRCVPITECTCPPQCSHQFCGSPLVQNSAALIPCMRGPPPYTEANCTDDCQLTYCQACYYYPRPLPPPPGCRYRNVSKGCFCCLREWARCVKDRNRRDNTCTGDCQTEENFKCYDYHLCL